MVLSKQIRDVLNKLENLCDLKQFLKEKKAQLRDGDFWAVIEEKRFMGVALYKKLESLQSTKTILLGVKIKENKC